jgi:hypothetical protein
MIIHFIFFTQRDSGFLKNCYDFQGGGGLKLAVIGDILDRQNQSHLCRKKMTIKPWLETKPSQAKPSPVALALA